MANPVLGTLIFPLLAPLVPAEGVYPGVAAQGADPPFIVYQTIHESGEATMGGASGLVRSRVQVDAYARTAYEAEELAGLIVDALVGLSGAARAVELGGQGPFFENESQLFRRMSEFSVWTQKGID